MVYDPKITDRILSVGQFVSFTAQAGGYETLLKLRAKADHERLSPEEVHRRDGIEAYFEMKLEILSSLLRDGILPMLAISSDAGPFDVSFGGLQYGLELAVMAGMSPVQAIQAATHTASRVSAALSIWRERSKLARPLICSSLTATPPRTSRPCGVYVPSTRRVTSSLRYAPTQVLIMPPTPLTPKRLGHSAS